MSEQHQNNDIQAIMVRDLIREKRADRRWKTIRSLAWLLLFSYIIVSLFKLTGHHPTVPAPAMSGKYTALIRLEGMIAPGRDFSAYELTPILQEAFADKGAAGVMISINSPGGTPVQAAIIHDTILAFKKKYHKKVIVVGEDLLTSGAYYVAVAGDKIYVNPNTITGSIGVIMKSFGFVDLMKKVGIERRVYIAGSNKDRLDPFLPETSDDLKKIQEVIGDVHQNFESAVLEGRKGKLRAEPSILFTGDFWSGQQAVTLGLVDGLGNLMNVMETEFGTTQYKEYGNNPSLFRLLNGQLNSLFDSRFYLYYAQS